jgi:hypothetical protein
MEASKEEEIPKEEKKEEKAETGQKYDGGEIPKASSPEKKKD